MLHLAALESPRSGLSRAALEAAYLRLEKPVFNVVMRWVWDAAEARDVVQDAFARVWQRRAQVQERTLEPLVWQTALNLAANRRRAHRVRRLFGLKASATSTPTATSEEQLAQAQQQAAVRAAIDALPEKLKQVVVLCELSGASYQDISTTLGIPAGTVASRRNAAMRKLESLLGPLEDAA